MMNMEDLFYHFNDEVAVRALREALLKFGYGLKVSRRISSHKIYAFPTQRRYDLKTHKGIWEIDFDLTCFIGQVSLDKLLQDILLQEEFEQWNREQWEDWFPIQFIVKEGSAKQ
jgi:hypothetical protein